MQYRIDYIGGPADRRSELHSIRPQIPWMYVAEQPEQPKVRPWAEPVHPVVVVTKVVEYRLIQLEENLYVAIARNYRGPQ